MTIDFNSMIEDSHNIQYFSRYLRKIDDIISIQTIIPWELYGVRTPFDLTVNDLNFEIKIQYCTSDRICLEQYTDHDKEIRGCIHNLKDNWVDIIMFFFPDNNEFLACYAPLLQEWWEKNCNRYKTLKNRISKDNVGNTWQSSFSAVFMTDIPENIIWFTNIERKEIGLENWW